MKKYSAKNYRAWMLMLLIVAAMLGSSAISPMYSEASKVAAETTEADRQEAAPGGSLQSSASREPAPDQYLGRLSLKVARRGHASVALSDGRVAIIGGQNETGPVSEVEVVNAQSQSIEVVANLKVARSRPTATLLSDGKVLIAGGWDRKKLFATTEVFNPQTNLISRGPKLRRPRAAHTATVLRDGRILITGGTPDGSAELFDPATNRTTLLGSKLTAARSFHAASLLGDGNVLLVGGVDQDGRSLRSAEIFDVGARTFFPTSAPMRIKRVRATLHPLPNGKVQVIGGDS
ncbi:MAG TPA: kelch repeat-containing protein, partial [Blastocatellia bacterium]|nr:kelch repeat-containing protein [Blastocatellia bacterium]